MAVFPTRLKPDPRVRVHADGSQTPILDPDARPFLAKLRVATPSGDVSLRQYGVDMNQMALQSCAGNATAQSEEVLSNIAGFAPVPVSRLFIYNLSRNEYGDLAHDDGTYVRVCFDVLARYGVCDEYLCPYDAAKVFTLPSLMAMRQALGHKIKAYYRIIDTANPGDRVDACIQALRANHPVVFGTQVSYDFMNLTDTTSQKPPTSNVAGSHAMVLVGFVGGMFIVKNSWGSAWGDGGYCNFDPTYVSWSQSADFWVPTLGVDFSS